MSELPIDLDYRMPAEWEPHAATWLSWPYNRETWEGHLDGAENAFAKLVEALTRKELVHLLVPHEHVEKRARQKLQERAYHDKNLRWHRIETGDVWFRDYGPLFIKNKEGNIAWTDWTYNAYGNKYDDLLIGNNVSRKMPIQKIARFEAGIVLEGGSVDVNGSGSLLTTESCLLSDDRNPDLSQKEIEQVLRDYLGITNMLWLARGIAGDDTTGHVDDVARFVGPSTVVAAIEEDKDDENYTPLRENLERLQGMHDEKGGSLEVIMLPMPKKFFSNGRRMAASYANFYIANGTVLVPMYDQPSDSAALDTLEQLFPDRSIVGIDSRALIFGYGALHCITMQEPA
jgi:agmatine deiminase